jgi:hypothetical protein
MLKPGAVPFASDFVMGSGHAFVIGSGHVT